MRIAMLDYFNSAVALCFQQVRYGVSVEQGDALRICMGGNNRHSSRDIVLAQTIENLLFKLVRAILSWVIKSDAVRNHMDICFCRICADRVAGYEKN